MTQLTDDTLKREIAGFSKRIYNNGGLSPLSVNEIPLVNCDSGSVLFQAGDIWSLAVEVSIELEKKNDHYTIKEIRYIHVKFPLILPGSALKGFIILFSSFS